MTSVTSRRVELILEANALSRDRSSPTLLHHGRANKLIRGDHVLEDLDSASCQMLHSYLLRITPFEVTAPAPMGRCWLSPAAMRHPYLDGPTLTD